MEISKDELVDSPEFFFAELGGLHDADIRVITWNPEKRSVEIDVDDLNANFDGLPEYPGKRPAILAFGDVQNLALNCDGQQGDIQRVYRFKVLRNEISGQFEASLIFSPSGQLNFHFANVAVGKQD